MELEFTTGEIPTETAKRTAEPNPFDGHFPSDDKSIIVKLPGTVLTSDADKAAINKVKSQARKAAKAVDRTARIQENVTSEGTGKAKHEFTVLTIWTVARITRPRKNDAPAETPAVVSAA